MDRCFSSFRILLISIVIFATGCAGGSLTTREKGAGIGALGGAAAGGIIGAAVGHPGTGAAIGGALGLGTGALIGDQLQGQEIKQAEQQKAIDQQRAEIAKNQGLIEELKKRNIEARETSRGVMVNLPSVNFRFDSAELTSDGRSRVDQIASIVKREAPNRRITVEGHEVMAGAGAPDLNVALTAHEHSLTGLEFLSGIPGTIGGAFPPNAGAYGGELAEVLISAEAVDRAGKVFTVTPGELGLSYRHSKAPTDWIFTSARLRAAPVLPFVDC